jgi:hypothetical protein
MNTASHCLGGVLPKERKYWFGLAAKPEPVHDWGDEREISWMVIYIYILFSFLNLSQASLSVAKTAAEII